MSMTASNAGQWINCPGSVLMRTLYPGDVSDMGGDTEEVREGKAFHYIAADILKSCQDIDKSIPTINDLIGDMTPYDIVVDHQMAQAAIDYVTHVMSYVNQSGTLRDMHVEERVSLDTILGEGKYCIPDLWIWDSKKLELFVMDGKYGYRPVEVFENWQLIIYALAILDKLDVNGLTDQVISIRLGIYQPRCYHVDGPAREWTFKASDLRGYRNQLEYAIEKATHHDAKCIAGSWCRTFKCSAAHTCPALQGSAYNYLDHTTNSIPIELDEQSVTAEYLILKNAERLIKTRREALEEQCKAMIKQGRNLPGLATEQGYGRETWKKDIPVDQIIMMGELMGEDIKKPVELQTPSQCRKKGIDASVIKHYSYIPKTSVKLVEDDGRKARQVFRKQ